MSKTYSNEPESLAAFAHEPHLTTVLWSMGPEHVSMLADTPLASAGLRALVSDYLRFTD